MRRTGFWPAWPTCANSTFSFPLDSSESSHATCFYLLVVRSIYAALPLDVCLQQGAQRLEQDDTKDLHAAWVEGCTPMGCNEDRERILWVLTGIIVYHSRRSTKTRGKGQKQHQDENKKETGVPYQNQAARKYSTPNTKPRQKHNNI